MIEKFFYMFMTAFGQGNKLIPPTFLAQGIQYFDDKKNTSLDYKFRMLPQNASHSGPQSSYDFS